MNKFYDIVVIGAGLVGTSFVCAMREQGMRIAVLEHHLPGTVVLPIQKNNRPISLAYGSATILKTLGLWSELAESACPITAIHVSEQGRFGKTQFTAAEMGVPALGYVVSFSLLQQLLYRHAAVQEGVDFINVQSIEQIETGIEGACVTAVTANQRQKWNTFLVVAADGSHSVSRQLLGIDTYYKNHEDVAFTASIDLKRKHNNVAYERFTQQGVLAILPMLAHNQCRLVWTMTKSVHERINTWNNEKLCEYVQNCFGDRLGCLQSIRREVSFPLETIIAKEQVRPSFVLLGNAAHTIYPLAAQGFNLGLRDAMALSDVLNFAHKRDVVLGDREILQCYINLRQKDQKYIVNLTQGISDLFTVQLSLLGYARALGMLTMDLVTPLKKHFAKRTMGLASERSRCLLGRGMHK